jgi:hypothetical protein
MAWILLVTYKYLLEAFIEYPYLWSDGEMTMNSEKTSKKDIYQAGGYAALLVISSFPLSILGMRVLNFVLSHIQV